MQEKPSLRTSEGLSPLRRFRGKLVSYTPSDEQGTRGTFRRWTFDFTDVDVIEATEPYPFPIASLSISQSRSAGSLWGAFGKSVLRALGDNDDLDLLIGKMQEWAMLPATLRRPLRDEEGNPIIENNREVWGDVKVDCWQVVSVDGLTSAPADVTGAILDMLDGKTDAQFHQVFQSSELARKNVGLMTENVNRQLLPRLEAEGKASRDAEGIWHKV